MAGSLVGATEGGGGGGGGGGVGVGVGVFTVVGLSDSVIPATLGVDFGVFVLVVEELHGVVVGDTVDMIRETMTKVTSLIFI